MGAPDPLLALLGKLHKALLDPGTWSLAPLAETCGQAIKLRTAELEEAARPAPRFSDPIIAPKKEPWP